MGPAVDPLLWAMRVNKPYIELDKMSRRLKARMARENLRAPMSIDSSFACEDLENKGSG